MNFRIRFLSLFLFLILLFSYSSTKAAIQPDSTKAVEKDKTEKEHFLYLSSGFNFTLGLGKEIYAETRTQKKFNYKDLVFDLVGMEVRLLVVTR